MSFFDLNRQLDSQHIIENGISIMDYSTSTFDLAGTLQKTLVGRYKLRANFPLDKIHECLEHEEIQRHRKESGHWYDPLQTLGEPMINEYYTFVNGLSQHLGFDFVFEHNPLVRYHIPTTLDDRYRLPDGELFTHHSDTLLGDYFQQINIWLPFCDVKNTAALSVCSKRASLRALKTFAHEQSYSYDEYKDSRIDFFDYAKQRPQFISDLRMDAMPTNLRYGQCLMFDPRVLHGTAENTENVTRVSMDFRIIPVDDYESIIKELQLQGGRPNSYEGEGLIKGEFYNALTAREVVSR
ncbi:mitomycin antibiotic biosynthesis protein [Pseudomonas amygdali]|uniref:mitomycin antibiotic biosynthesis protein n=1 Tax=Pseudomonas amygdali TaxID=47877 RepID=UPI001C587139|nr:mitomycin antibiotic biosynthesis protein [Pseudomonas amygdali]QXW45228.1 mitomycin antibiotic biosynthesis protein [Pseudomonas amygdali]